MSFNKKHNTASLKVEKKEYEMFEGLPIWRHLENNGTLHESYLCGSDYGVLAERIGKRVIRLKIKYEKFLNELFPDIEIISVFHRIKFKSAKRSREYGDYCVEISYKSNDKYGKKILIVEIKHGLIHIHQKQIRRYSNYILNPSAYFRKADEVKIIFMLFTEINTLNATTSYYLSEFNKEIATKIIDATSKVNEADEDTDIFGVFDKVQKDDDWDMIEESVRCKHSWKDCDNSYSSTCDYCIRNDLCEEKKGDYYRESRK